MKTGFLEEVRIATTILGSFEHTFVFVDLVQHFPAMGMTGVSMWVLLDLETLLGVTCDFGMISVPTAVEVLSNLSSVAYPNSCLLWAYEANDLLIHMPLANNLGLTILDENFYDFPGYFDLERVLKERLTDYEAICNHQCTDVLNDELMYQDISSDEE